MEEETVTISLVKFKEMEKQLAWLEALECAGVDNWGGIDEAIDLFREWRSEVEVED